MLKINSIKPLFNKIVTTCDVYEKGKTEGNIIVKTEGTIKEYQRVEAVGSKVRDIKVGDLVLINPKRYAIVDKERPKLCIDRVDGIFLNSLSWSKCIDLGDV